MSKYVVVFSLYLLLFDTVNIANSEEIICPSLCHCDMTFGLRTARCTGQQINSVEVDFPEQVQHVDLSDNVISSLENYAFSELKLHKLIALNISYNMISVISLRAFDGLKYLKLLDLSNNVLHTLSQDLFESNTDLRRLYLSGNKFGTPNPEPFLASQSLEILDISRCLISHLHEEMFSKTPSLYTVDISHNLLIDLNVKVFNKLPNLKMVKLLDNNFSCNNKMTEVLQYFTTNQISFEEVCKKIEKSQKMVQLPIGNDIDESSQENGLELVDWNFDSCDIEGDRTKLGETHCEIVYDNKMLSLFIFGLTFACGLLSGVFLSCVYVSFIYITKKKRTNRPRNRTIRRRPASVCRRPLREEYLLADTSFDIGLSTPVLPRANRTFTTPIIRQ